MNKKGTKTVGKLHNPDGSFAVGHPPMGGRPLGSLDFKTKWLKFLDKIAEQNGKTRDEMEQQLLTVAWNSASKADYSFWRDIHDRVYGRAESKVDLTTAGESLNVQQSDAELEVMAHKIAEELKKKKTNAK